MSAGLGHVEPTMALAMIDEAKAKGYRRGVIGLRGLPDADAVHDLQHDGQPVLIRPAESALAVREVLLEAPSDGWLAIVTDRPDDDLGAGILAHLVWSRLRSPYPWDAVRARFGASGIETALVSLPTNREIAAAVLAATPADGWPYAPAGMLTRDHLLRCVAAAHLALPEDALDLLGVLRWTLQPDLTARVLALRTTHGHALADEVLRWVAELCGSAEPIARRLFANGEISDLAPVGIVVDVLAGAPAIPERDLAAVRVEQRYGLPSLFSGPATAFGSSAISAIGDELDAATTLARRALNRADAILRELGASGFAADSDVLAAGRQRRQADLARALGHHVADPASSSLAGVDQAWTRLTQHRDLAPLAASLPPLEAGVRLCRWLVTPVVEPGRGADADLGRLAYEHLHDWSWADAAINDAAVGVDDHELSRALHSVITAALERRRAEDRSFAHSLAAVTARGGGQLHASRVAHDGLHAYYVEHLLPSVILPVARRQRTLLVVLDGMAAATANEIVEDATSRLGWTETGIGVATRMAALTALPSLTEVSRCSLLSGELRRGDQFVERKTHAALLHRAGLTGRIFHKKEVETRAHGTSVADDVSHALRGDDQLVTVVLNTIDDALDRSDPSGTVWTADAVKNLGPLLNLARSVGRLVILTADHGHVVERRAGTQRSHATISSSRSRAADSEATDGEVQVAGHRVLTDDQTAVLAVDADLRYGPLMAGYHGGASASEVVVPVIALWPEELDMPSGLVPLPPQPPVWWLGSADLAAPTVTAPAIMDEPLLRTSGTLFEAMDPEPRPQPIPLGEAVIASEVFQAQLTVTGRTSLDPQVVAHFIDRASSVPGGRVARALAAQTLGIPEGRLRGAVAQLTKLLNVEGYAVVRTDPATGAIDLDLALLREQFEVTG